VDTAATSHATLMASVIRISLVDSIRLVMLLSDTATDYVHATVRSLGLLGSRAVLLRSQGRTLHRFKYCGHMFPAVLMSRRMPRLRIVSQTCKMKAEVPARPGSWTSLPRRGRKALSLATKLHQISWMYSRKPAFLAGTSTQPVAMLLTGLQHDEAVSNNLSMHDNRDDSYRRSGVRIHRAAAPSDVIFMKPAATR
jgi:hypothetical protein